jgi:5-methylcytosine-specific restriction endonuclease McrBC regulatory subunit McrC
MWTKSRKFKLFDEAGLIARFVVLMPVSLIWYKFVYRMLRPADMNLTVTIHNESFVQCV